MKLRFLPTILVIAGACFPAFAVGAMVSYQGLLVEPFFDTILVDDFVIAGTFAPGFDPFRYKFAYGDVAGNLHPQHYSRAVADGNFRPIGTGTLADANGMFSGSGVVTSIDNQPIFLFLSDHGDLDQLGYLALVSSTAANWRVQGDGDTSIDAATANVFVFGSRRGDGGIALQISPIPEPAMAALFVSASLLCISRKRRTVTGPHSSTSLSSA